MVTFQTVAGVMGNVLEWYDFSLFGYFSAEIAENFFPPEAEGSNGNLIKSFSIFGAAYLMRPIGGLVIGYVGDKHGRKKALMGALFLMAIPTTAMGFLPTYSQVGWWATLLLVVCRLLQGISVGGQLPASLVYTVEPRPKEQWGYYGSFPMVAAKCGSLLGNLCGALMREILTEEQLVDFGWRIPFLSGILIAFVALYLRCHGEEVHTNANVYDHQDSEIKNPIRASFRKGNRMALLSTSLTPMLWSAGSVLSFIWMPIYMSELVEPPVDHAFWINAGAMFSGVIFMLPLAGHISDKVGRTKTMTVAACFLGILGPIMVILIAQSIPVLAFFAQLVLGITLSFFGGPLCAWLVENYSPEVRLTSASLGYDIAHAIAGGVSPAMATALADGVGIYSPGMLYTIFAFVSLIGIITMHCLKGGAGGVDKELDSGVSSTEEASSATNTKPSEMELPEMS